MKEKIDEFVAAFFPEMQRIQSLTESDTNKLKGVRELAPCSPREVRGGRSRGLWTKIRARKLRAAVVMLV